MFDIIFCSHAVEIFTATLIRCREGDVGLDIAMFTYKIFERRDSLHFGGRVGVDDAEVHLPAQSTKN